MQLAKQHDMLLQINERLAAINISLQSSECLPEKVATGGDEEKAKQLMINLVKDIECTQVAQDMENVEQFSTALDDNELDDIINQQIPVGCDNIRPKQMTAVTVVASTSMAANRESPADGFESSSDDDLGDEVMGCDDLNSEMASMVPTAGNDGRLTNRSAEADTTDSARSEKDSLTLATR